MSEAALSPAVPKPDHIPDAVVYDFDLFADPKMKREGHARALELVREAPPIFWTPRNGGHWMIAGHNAVFEASKDYGAFTSEIIPFERVKQMRAALPEGAPHILLPTPITMDPPTHTTYRLPLQGVFSPKAMVGLKDHVRELAVKLIEDVKANGKCAFMHELAEPLPVQVFLELFGLPTDRQRQYRDLVKEHMAQNVAADPKIMQQRLYKLTDVMHDTIMDRKENPKNDMISMLWKSEFEGKPATLNDIEDYCVVLFTAGLDTVMNAMGLGVLHLATHLDL